MSRGNPLQCPPWDAAATPCYLLHSTGRYGYFEEIERERRRIQAAVKERHSFKEWPSKDNLINALGGTWDIEKQELRDPREDDYLRYSLSTELLSDWDRDTAPSTGAMAARFLLHSAVAPRRPKGRPLEERALIIHQGSPLERRSMEVFEPFLYSMNDYINTD